ncbi:hypothetical protein D3C85_1139240 [compost metagenome]
MKCSDLQLGHVKAFTQHVDTDNDSSMARLQHCSSLFEFVFVHLAMQHDGVVLPDRLVDRQDLSRARSSGDSRHRHMKPCGVIADLFHNLLRDILVSAR